MNLLCMSGRHKWRYVPFLRPPKGASREEASLHIKIFARKCITWQYCTACGEQRRNQGTFFGWEKRSRLTPAHLQEYNDAEAQGNVFGSPRKKEE